MFVLHSHFQNIYITLIHQESSTHNSSGKYEAISPPVLSFLIVFQRRVAAEVKFVFRPEIVRLRLLTVCLLSTLSGGEQGGETELVGGRG